VLATALFDKPAFKNLICNGLVLAADGKKMSKRLKNYPDPMEVGGPPAGRGEGDAAQGFCWRCGSARGESYDKIALA
jgi:hypothetical protein